MLGGHAHPRLSLQNLDDSVFAKRHAKLELDEKRRKRWEERGRWGPRQNGCSVSPPAGRCHPDGGQDPAAQGTAGMGTRNAAREGTIPHRSPVGSPGGLMLLPAVPHHPGRRLFQVGHSADQGTENFTAAAAPNVQKERDSGVGA